MTHEEAEAPQVVVASFQNERDEAQGVPIEIPLSASKAQLQGLCDSMLKFEEETPLIFFVGGEQIFSTLGDAISAAKVATERVVVIHYRPEAVFKVRPVTRCSSTLEAHTEAVISVQFSPDGCHLASGSGDTTVRFWDLTTETPLYTCKAHTHWVLCMAWSPDGKKLVSACKSGIICLWNPETGKQFGKQMRAHTAWINALCWEPLHKNGAARHFASASKDATVKIWDALLQTCLRTLSSHTHSITSLRWGGNGLIYTASQDRTVKVWRAADGVMCRTLPGHGHWVNSLALNVDYILRTGAFEPVKREAIAGVSEDMLQQRALKRYSSFVVNFGEEILASGSDDFTVFLWRPENNAKPVARLTGHQQPINQIMFSPDGYILATASFDKSIKLWNGRDGQYLASLRGHVGPVYQLAFAADSRLLVSGSSDSTLKLWDLRKRKLALDLPGHRDEVYAVDWSPASDRVVSGGKDRVLKLWRN